MENGLRSMVSLKSSLESSSLPGELDLADRRALLHADDVDDAAVGQPLHQQLDVREVAERPERPEVFGGRRRVEGLAHLGA